MINISVVIMRVSSHETSREICEFRIHSTCLKVTKSMYISQITRIIIHRFMLHVIFFIRIVVTSLPIYECNYYMAGKNIEKYHLWLWSSLVKILDLSLVALLLLMINPIFSLVMTITPRDIFCQPYTNLSIVP